MRTIIRNLLKRKNGKTVEANPTSLLLEGKNPESSAFEDANKAPNLIHGKNSDGTGKADTDQSIINPLKPQEHETETDEISGDPGLDNSALRENPRTAEEPAQQPEPGTPDGSESGTTELEKDISTPGISEEEFNAAVADAYKRGFLDGKNASIEEKYFPKTDDGIPAFRGRPSTAVLAGDIFSMAREA